MSPGTVYKLKFCDVPSPCAAGLSGPPSAALRGPEGQTILSYSDRLHELWSSGCHGKRQNREIVRVELVLKPLVILDTTEPKTCSAA